MNKIKQSIIAIVIGLALAGGVSFAETVWNDPTANPPGNNTDAPINVGDKTQTKTGAMNFDGVVQFNNPITPLIIPARAGVGKVLTSDADGKASWQPSTGGGGASVPQGTLCGFYMQDGSAISALCQGYNPYNGCPPGYTQSGGRTQDPDLFYTCVKN